MESQDPIAQEKSDPRIPLVAWQVGTLKTPEEVLLSEALSANFCAACEVGWKMMEPPVIYMYI